MPTNKQYVEQQSTVAQDFLNRRLSLEDAVRRIVQILQTCLADDDAWPEDPVPGGGQPPLRGVMWFAPGAPDLSAEDRKKLVTLSDRVFAELRDADGLTSA